MSTTRTPASGPRGSRAARLRPSFPRLGGLVICGPDPPFLLFGGRESNDREWAPNQGARRVGDVMVAKLQIRVAWDECDPDGLVHIVNYYRWMDQALHALMLEAGFGHRAILEKFGGYVPAVEASARCTAPLAF